MTAPAPIFIGGMFKSGTSLLRAMLGQHKNIAGGLETYWFEVDLKNRTGRGGEPLDDYLARLAAYYGMDAATVQEMAAGSLNAETFVDRFMAAVAKKAGKARWAEKTPGNITQTARIVKHWPDARILHIVRDPRDIYASLREAKKWDNAEAFGSRWCAMFAGCEQGRRDGSVRRDNYHELRYEALVLHPEPTMRRVLQFVGEAWDPAVAQFAGRDDEYEIVRAQTGKASTTLARMREPLSDSRVGLWRDVPAAELEAVRTYVRTRDLLPRYDSICAETEGAVAAAAVVL